MKFIKRLSVSVDQIRVSNRLRKVDGDYAQVLASSIEAGGLTQPIDVMARDDGYDLIAGAHRYGAVADILGWTKIEAKVWEAETDDPVTEARLFEIDENLYRHELNALDRAVFLVERKRVYESLYPEAKNGTHGGRGGKTNEKLIVSFSKDAAVKTGMSEATIKRATLIASKLTPAVRDQISGTKLATKEGELYKLAHLTAADQKKAVKLVLSAKAPTIEAARAAIYKEAPPDPIEVAVANLERVWAKAPQKARDQFLERVNGTARPKLEVVSVA